MSSLNLSPNPVIMAATGVVFIANLLAVKKLFLEPYLKVRDQRIKATFGNQAAAEQLEVENTRATEKIRDRIAQASLEARNFRDSSLATAKQKRDELLAAASKEATDVVTAMRGNLVKELAEQRQAVPAIVQQLSRQFVDRLIPH
jgi:F0F1-type ATP synthase membrane subunit b/b'